MAHEEYSHDKFKYGHIIITVNFLLRVTHLSLAWHRQGCVRAGVYLCQDRGGVYSI